MSPKNITRIALTIGLISLIGILAIVVSRPDWGIWIWWPVMGLGASFFLLVVAFLYGAYLAAQRRAEMVDMLNDCYAGSTQTTKS